MFCCYPLDESPDVEFSYGESETASLQFRKIKEVVDHPKQALRVPMYDLHCLALGARKHRRQELVYGSKN